MPGVACNRGKALGSTPLTPSVVPAVASLGPWEEVPEASIPLQSFFLSPKNETPNSSISAHPSEVPENRHLTPNQMFRELEVLED